MSWFGADLCLGSELTYVLVRSWLMSWMPWVMGSKLAYVLDSVSRGFGACLSWTPGVVGSELAYVWDALRSRFGAGLSWTPGVVGSELAYVLDAYQHLYPDDF